LIDIIEGKRKREESKVEEQEEQEEGGSKRLKPFEGDEEPTQPDEGEEQEAFAAVEPTLIVTEDCGDDEGPTQIIEEVVEVETTQMVVETLEAVLAGHPQCLSRVHYSGAARLC
jgi:hypothetical protein